MTKKQSESIPVENAKYPRQQKRALERDIIKMTERVEKDSEIMALALSLTNKGITVKDFQILQIILGVVWKNE